MYAVYLHAVDAQRVVKCDIMANHRRAAHPILHFTFRIPHAAVPHFTHINRHVFNNRLKVSLLSRLDAARSRPDTINQPALAINDFPTCSAFCMYVGFPTYISRPFPDV